MVACILKLCCQRFVFTVTAARGALSSNEVTEDITSIRKNMFVAGANIQVVCIVTSTRGAASSAGVTEDNAFRCFCYDSFKSSIEQCWSDRR